MPGCCLVEDLLRFEGLLCLEEAEEDLFGVLEPGDLLDLGDLRDREYFLGIFFTM